MHILLILLCIKIVSGNDVQKFYFEKLNITQFDIRETCIEIINTDANVTAACRSQLEIVCNNYTLLWTMFDAASKFPYTGISYATNLDLGNFDECMTVDHMQNDQRILGKHCAAGFLIPTTLDPATFVENAFKLSICIPDACYAQDLTNLLNIPSYLPLFNDNLCTTKETGTDWAAWQIVILSVFVLIGLLMVASTIYDMYLHKKELKSARPLLIAFSCLTNGKKLLHTTKVGTKEQILCFHGIKFISMMWIIAGHSFVAWNAQPLTNHETGREWLNQRYSQYISPAYLAVDTFFFISGFLLAYMYFKQEPKPLKDHLMRVPNLYIHRYLRLTPPVAMLFLFQIGIFEHVGTGPIYHRQMMSDIQVCKDNWWSYFLYLQNYYNYDNLCIVQTWYLSADMQLFLLSPLIVIPIAMIYKKDFKMTMYLMLALNLLFTFLPMGAKFIWRDYTNEYDTHSRFIDYYIGFMLGLYMREKKDQKFPFSRIQNVLIWILMLAGMFTVVCCYQEVHMNNYSYESLQTFYSLMRPAWCIGLSWIVYSCQMGHGGFVNWILSQPSFQVGSKLSYCMYLTHMIIIYYWVLTSRTHRFFTDYIAFYDWCGHFIITLVVATLWTLAFESPLIIIEKFIFGGAPKPPRNEKQPNVENGKHQIA